VYILYVHSGLDPVPFAYNINLMSELTQMGFPEEACRRALFFTNNQGLNEASNWLMEHISDSDFSEPFTIPGTETGSGLNVTLFLCHMLSAVRMYCFYSDVFSFITFGRSAPFRF